MKKYQKKSVNDPSINKKRPSIQFSPTLQKPVYIITKNLNGPHIIHLIQELDKRKIPYQMQQETQTLGFKLNQRFFVIVDNKYGQVTLGPQFGSILMTVVGYPRIGKNKKNKYFEKTLEIINFYEVFKNNRDISERQKSLINKEYSDIILQKADSSSKIKSKIMVRSISKYKSPEKDSKVKFSGIKQNNSQKKLYIIEDSSSDVYSKLCDEICSLISKECLQRVGSVDQVRKKTLFIANHSNIFYLVNQKNERDLLDVIFIGQALVFNSQIAAHNLTSAFTQPKIYGISSEQKQIFKMLQCIGFLPKEESQVVVVSKLPQNSQLSGVKQPIKQEIKPVQTIQPQKTVQPIKLELKVPQVSKIEAIHSVMEEKRDKENDLNMSKISQASTKSRKIKRVNKSKPKNNVNASLAESQYFGDKKQNEEPKQQKHQNSTNRKKTLKTEQKEIINKQKKSLKFVILPEEQIKVKRIKSISRFQPKKIQIQTENNATMTESQYFPTYKIARPFAVQSQNLNPSQISSKTSTRSNFSKQLKSINAVFYRQFIQSFAKAIELIKATPSLFFSEPQKSQTYQPFFNMTEFDRYAKRIKRKLKEAGSNCQEFRFLVFLLQEQLPAFEKYCFEKNKSYEEEGYEMESIMKATNFSSTFTTAKIPKLTISLFIESDCQVHEKVLNFGNIKLLQFGFPRVVQVSKLEEPLQLIRQKLIRNNLIESQDYYRS